MESMRSLNTSLPSASPRKQPPPEQLLQAFKTAALSVTNLYKTAASDQTRAHAEGYQDALDELLGFLDKEDMGLGEGEGWRVRQWIMERQQTEGRAQQTMADSDGDEEAEEERRARSSSPATASKPDALVNRQATPQRDQPTQRPAPDETARSESAPPNTHSVVHRQTPPPPVPRGEFTFRQPPPTPMSSLQDLDLDSLDFTPRHMRLEVVSRAHHRSPRHNRQAGAAGAGRNGSSLGTGAGIKRKFPLGDYFDIGGLGLGNGNGKDGHNGGGGGGKRSRHA
ncbi:hypothetical protein BDY21DRAFT_370778 [Lineolata rhizophorae]|uniref:Uncharacterized protein n=1 Tax=Lineolata rhizophorae TaxID=578093 RepID=A0A6A6P3L2_9PEZI|nr:hypothetical protein BDY21DRAFT_370778 [Lineolata rhizophorae]